MSTPNIAGFADAQHRLREAFGEPIDFVLPTSSVTFPPGTAIDPETGEPYDPTIHPTSSAAVTASALCNVVFHAIGRMQLVGEQKSGPLGYEDQNHVLLIADYAASGAIHSAEEFRCRDEMFKVTAMKHDGIGSPHQRWLVYGRRKG